MRKVILSLAFVVFTIALTGSAAAQTAFVTLRGNVVDEQGGALPGVTLTAREIQTNTVSTAVSGGQGGYFLTNLRPGKYELTAELSGFRSYRQSLALRVGEDLTVSFTMTLAGLNSSVEVVGESVPVQTQSTVGTVISQKQIDDLPTISRDFSALAKLAPGTTQSGMTGATASGTGISISGMRPYQNNIVVDGASNLMQFYGRQANDFPCPNRHARVAWSQHFVISNSFLHKDPCMSSCRVPEGLPSCRP